MPSRSSVARTIVRKLVNCEKTSVFCPSSIASCNWGKSISSLALEAQGACCIKWQVRLFDQRNRHAELDAGIEFLLQTGEQAELGCVNVSRLLNIVAPDSLVFRRVSNPSHRPFVRALIKLGLFEPELVDKITVDNAVLGGELAGGVAGDSA